MGTLRSRLRAYLMSHFYRLEPWRWVILLMVGVGLARLEVYEFQQRLYWNQPFHLFEAVLYFVLIIGNGIFLEVFVRLNRIHRRMNKILQYKHKLSLELSLINDWESLVTKLAELPGSAVDAREASLLMIDPVPGKLEAVSRWIHDEHEPNLLDPDTLFSCPECLQQESSSSSSVHRCRKADDNSPYNIYSVKIVSEVIPGTMLKFRLSPYRELSPFEEKLLHSIGDEIAVAIQAGQNHRLLSELQSARVAMAERRTLSAYLHDQLAQNLGYLHLKLDQLGTDEYLMRSGELRKEMEHLRTVASDAYEIVRDILKKTQPETVPHLTNLLKEHATRVSRMGSFALRFKNTGMPVQLLPDTQETIFYAFHEVLSNVQKHSRADAVDVDVCWNDGCLEILVADNGIGFDPGCVPGQEHFGLEILRERVAHLNGKLVIDTSPSGTLISMSVPYERKFVKIYSNS